MKLKNREEKKIEKTEQSLSDLLNNIKLATFQTTGVIKERKNKLVEKKIFLVMSEYFTDLTKDINLEIQETQQTPNRTNSKKIRLDTSNQNVRKR